MKVIDAIVSAPEAKVAIIISRFNRFINDNLLKGAIDVLKRIGQVKDKNITLIWVPGSYEIPLTAHILTKSKKYDALIALGSIIRGDTTHFEYIASNAISGITNVAIKNEIPISFSILTTENTKQAIERAGVKAGNKGSEAALTTLEMINIFKTIKTESRNE